MRIFIFGYVRILLDYVRIFIFGYVRIFIFDYVRIFIFDYVRYTHSVYLGRDLTLTKSRLLHEVLIFVFFLFFPYCFFLSVPRSFRSVGLHSSSILFLLCNVESVQSKTMELLYIDPRHL